MAGRSSNAEVPGICKRALDLQPDRINYLADTVQESVARVARHFEVEFVTLHLFRSGDDAQNKPYVRTSYPDAWVSHYLLNDYVRIDPVLQMAETTRSPFCWSDISLNAEQQDMMREAAKRGVCATGFSITHVDTIGRRSVLSFNAREAQGGDTWKPFLQMNHEALTQLSGELHRMAISEVSGGSEKLPQLTPREIECLKWTAAGKAHTEIAIILNLSEHTVRSYLKEARIKLDSVTLAQAVSKAASLGLI